jgi:hypothetical protein
MQSGNTPTCFFPHFPNCGLLRRLTGFNVPRRNAQAAPVNVCQDDMITPEDKNERGIKQITGVWKSIARKKCGVNVPSRPINGGESFG